MREWVSLYRAVATAWRAYDNAAGLAARVNPAVPILFFGDLAAYRVSTLRVVTVGLNPSRQEFPASRPFSRFPSADGPMERDPDRYLSAMSSYYRIDPYRAWFSAFEPLLNGAGASYYPGHASTSLHTDICSPVATDPTWSKLSGADQSTLAADGGPLWHMLLKALKPQIVVMSVARHHIERIEFDPSRRRVECHAHLLSRRRAARLAPARTRSRRAGMRSAAVLRSLSAVPPLRTHSV